MAAVRRAWMSFWLMRSIAISTPACLPNSFACSSKTWSAAGMKCDHCKKCSRAPCARAGAAPAAVRTPTAADVLRKSRRVRRLIMTSSLMAHVSVTRGARRRNRSDYRVMADECMFVPEGDSFQRARSSRAQRRAWCLPGSRSICGAPSRASASRRASPVLREGRKARTVEASLVQGGKPIARCTAVFLRVDPALNAAPVDRTPPRLGPDAGRPIADVARRWSPFFTGVDTRTVDGNLLKPGPAACWFNLERALVPGETNSALVHTVSAADFASGISAVVNLGSDLRERRPDAGLLVPAARALDLAELGDARGRSGSGGRNPSGTEGDAAAVLGDHDPGRLNLLDARAAVTDHVAFDVFPTVDERPALGTQVGVHDDLA